MLVRVSIIPVADERSGRSQLIRINGANKTMFVTIRGDVDSTAVDENTGPDGGGHGIEIVSPLGQRPAGCGDSRGCSELEADLPLILTLCSCKRNRHMNFFRQCRLLGVYTKLSLPSRHCFPCVGSTEVMA